MDAGRVSEIHERINKLSSEIARQRDILRDLENQKSAAQGELNTILDPMSRLPLEISSDIMLRCFPTTPKVDPHAAPMIFLDICRSWSNIALATPALWAAMPHVETAMSDDFGRLMGIWVARAGTHPLTLSLRGNIYSETAALQTFLDLCLWDRVQTLSVSFPSGSQLGEFRVRGSFPNLHALTIGRNKDNSVRVDEWDDDYYSRNASDCIEMLFAAPNLVECTLNGIYFDSAFAPSRSPSRAMIHSNIKALYLGGWGWESGIFSSSAYMLPYLTLPSLERLTISVFDIELRDFLAFLARSAPPLRFLRMSVPSEYLETRDAPMEKIFRLTPRITDLNLSHSTYWIRDDMASVLRAIGSPFLPDLRNLTIHFRSSRWVEPPPYEEVLGALSGRRTYSPMQAFKLMWREKSDVNWEPTPDVITGFQQLKEDGMQIYVGTPARNFI
ncbi:hypothetical protein B0H11DRAFT_245434 [Mycena galericulata]|nr:hypothetical protein B0H11DRAFT_245434 [Mycena galericulata]